MQKVIHNTYTSKIVHDLDKNILIKTLKKEPYIDQQWFDLYQKLQEKTPNVVKIFDMIDKRTYTMEYLEHVIDNFDDFTKQPRAFPPKKKFTKLDFVRLHKCIYGVWTSALELSVDLPDHQFFTNNDAKLANICILKHKSGYQFKFIDADGWSRTTGYHGMDCYYQTQLKIALQMQRILVPNV
tara:strand:- start:325 stop:873 length:549 start_codon:yes stop_codon:yes gene_type:complete